MWAVATLAISVAACTTGSGVSQQGGSLVAETLASAAAQSQGTTAEAASTTPTTVEGAPVLAMAATTPANPAAQNLLQGPTVAAAQAASAENASSSAIPVPAPLPAVAKADDETGKAEETTQSPPKGVQMVAYTGAARPMELATPAVDSVEDGSVMRLFVDNPSKKREKRLEAPKKSTRDYNYALPGVRENLGLEIKRRRSLDDDGDIDANEEDGSFPVQLASAGGLGRLLPRGLEKQRASVETACLKPKLLTILKTVEQHFRRPVMITSGYRSPSYNRLVRGAPRSRHMLCEAADIVVQGVSKWEIANFVRKLPGRGGVGTYCHTDSVHVDIGPERDWNWRCVARR
ncbi:YcbK family protein [Brucella endophytica]|uniref:YcbK family protein n=1 Tax=Brucella endophytica TaxID=1963359 RepID=UPI001F2C0685|nr:YcbK family protein [Brucella endophytica]